MSTDWKLSLEHAWHESEDFARDANSLIVGVYASGVFDEAEAGHLAALGDVAGQHALDYGCGTGGKTQHPSERIAEWHFCKALGMSLLPTKMCYRSIVSSNLIAPTVTYTA